MSLFDKLKNLVSKKEEIRDGEEKEVIENYEEGLKKTRDDVISKLNILGIKYTKVSEEYFEELESLLIMADIGVNTVLKFMDKLRSRVKKENITDTNYLKEVIVDELLVIYVEGESLSDKIKINPDGPTVILMVGVNGVGKTTTIGKLAYKYKEEGKSVMLIAGEDNIREVIAFPKNKKARDVLMGAPSKVSEEQLKDVHIRLDLENDDK